MRNLSLSLILVAALAAPSFAEPEPRMPWDAEVAPAPAPDWPATLETLGRALSETEPMVVLSLLANQLSIESLNNPNGDNVYRLLESLGSGRLVSRHAYTGTPATMASDIAADFQAAADFVPEPVVQRMQIAERSNARQANAVASQWLEQALRPRPDQRVGVLVFWSVRNGSALPSLPSPPQHEIIFVLVKAEETAPGEFKVTRLVYGAP